MASGPSAEVIIIGGGHNGLVAAAYLARAGKKVVLLEARMDLGGAVASSHVFAGQDALLSRFSYLVSVLPVRIIDDLGLELELRSRTVASYTPIGDGGLLAERVEGPATRESFRAATGSDEEYRAWCAFHRAIRGFAEVVAPTLTGPLPNARELKRRVAPEIWRGLVERPIGELLESTFAHDTVRGVLLTDALIGTFADAHDPSLVQNRCFLYHMIGNGTGEWKVPVGGMGAVAGSLELAARQAGAELRSRTPVRSLTADRHGGGTVTLADGSPLSAPAVLANCAPSTLAALLGDDAAMKPEGSQLKINILVTRLPKFRSRVDPKTGFAGTLHLGQGYRQLRQAYQEAESGRIPNPVPSEVYCHSLTDPSILSEELQEQGFHTLTLFAVHTPARLFTDHPDQARQVAGANALASLQAVLAEPLEDCLAHDAQGNPCVEVMTPLDIEAATGMPGGHIFHGDLAWPWLADDAAATTPAQRWGVATPWPGILLCGSGAVRGGAVSGLGGQNAAMAVLEETQSPFRFPSEY